MMRIIYRICVALCSAAWLFAIAACSDDSEPASAGAPVASVPAAQTDAVAIEQEAVDSKAENAGLSAAEFHGPGKFLLTDSELGLPPELAPLQRPWTGDFDGMVERRVVRVLTVYQVGSYFLDGPEEKGIIYDLVKMFEKFLNERLGNDNVKLHVVLIPVEFDQLLDGLVQGYGDIAAAGLSITPERDEIVDFGAPLSREVKEIVITGPAAPEIDSIDDLSGKEIYIKRGSSYRTSLETLNERFRNEGRSEINIIDAQPHLQDLDLLEMVSAGLWPMVAMDDYTASFWAGVLEGLVVRTDLVIQSGQHIGWAIRDGSPLLMAEVNEFAQAHRQGTMMGNILINRYLRNTDWV